MSVCKLEEEEIINIENTLKAYKDDILDLEDCILYIIREINKAIKKNESN